MAKEKEHGNLNGMPVARQLVEPLFKGALRKKKITEDYLAGKLKEELEAKETKFFAFQGQVIDKKDVVAWDIRQRARKDAHELRGDYPARKVEAKHEHEGTIFHDLTARMEKAIEATEDAIRNDGKPADRKPKR